MINKMQGAVETLLKELGEDPTREGLVKTPERVEKSLRFLTRGYEMDVNDILNDALFEEEYDEMVICQNIEVYSMCEHHMLPFFGRAHIAYLPKHKIVGLSKLPRIVEIFARRLQVQERMTRQIAQTLWDVLDPLGVAVVVEARHLCMMMRGVEKQNSFVTTSAVMGGFKEKRMTRMELLELLKGGN